MDAIKTYTLKSKTTDHIWEFKFQFDGSFYSFTSLEGEFEGQQARWLITNFPYSEEMFFSHQSEFKQFFTVIIGVNEIDFETWYLAYNNKRTKKQSLEFWNKMNKPDRINAYLGIAKYDRYLKLNAWQQKVDPIRFLRNRRYEDEY